MAKRLDYKRSARADLTTQIGEEDDAPTNYWQIKKQHRAAIQRDSPDLPPAAIERLLNKRMARGYRPYRPTC